jgi:putative hemolysin
LDTDIPLSCYSFLVIEATLPNILTALGGIVFLLCCSALMSASEVAFFALSPSDIEKIRHGDEHPSYKKILRLIEMPQTLLATILIANTLINIGIVVISDFIIKDFFAGGLFVYWAQGLIDTFHWSMTAEKLADSINFLVTVVGVTAVLVLFAEIIPKLYARGNVLSLAKFMSGIVLFLSKFFGPFSRLLVSWTDRIEESIEERTGGSNIVTREDFDKAIELAMSRTETTKDVNILKSIVTFGDVAVKRVLCPRSNVIAIEINEDFASVLEIVKKSGFSRLPVYDEDLDNIKGILYSKDLIEHLQEPSHYHWQALVESEIVYTPETKKIDDMLRLFQKEKQHMAIVVDEYGGTAGIVTLEDIIEEIIGDIRDEFDDETEIDYKKIDDFNYIFEGKTLLNDVFRVLKIEQTVFENLRGDADSIGGLVLESTGIIPKKDTEVTLNGVIFKVVAVNKRRIEQVKVTLKKD